ncbi:hypothetical protein, partial [Bradyrhizobium liaoningense]|uniref:hypothetical protein n=1 Tax=Bradyrhizobium liaoningense TaxID=43992 RepID=UPI000552B9DC
GGVVVPLSVDAQSQVTQHQADQYERLAYTVKGQIEIGRAGSSLVQANFNLLGTTLAYAAVVDPEPVSKAVTGLAAWGSKKAGDALSQLVIEETQKQTKKILAQGLKNSGLSDAALKNMTADELRDKVADLKVGGEKLQEILKNDPESLRMLQANAVDIATNIGVEALARAEGTAADVKTVKQDLAKTKENIESYQKEVTSHLDKLDRRVAGLEQATRVANQKLNELKQQVQGNSKAIETLAQVSFSGWTTAQKIQAVQSGLFPDLGSSQKSALLESLKADKAREEAVAGINQAAQDFGNLAAIASNIGLPKDVVKGLQGAQVVASGLAQFATGSYLGAVASATSLVGLGAPDAAAQRHAEMMKYLQQQFAEINRKLDKIIDLQVQTLKAVAVLTKEQREFRREVLGQLDRIEDTVLRSEQILQAILLSEWKDCHALVNGTALNGQFGILSRTMLAEIVGNPNAGRYAAGCYSQMVAFLDAWVKPAKWSGQVIAAGNFPSDAIAGDTNLQKGWAAFQAQKVGAYTTARDFVLQSLTRLTVQRDTLLVFRSR